MGNIKNGFDGFIVSLKLFERGKRVFHAEESSIKYQKRGIKPTTNFL